MSKTVSVVGVLLLLLGGYLVYRWWFPPDETVIRRTLLDVAQAASVRPGAGGLDRLAAMNRLLSACTPDIEVFVDAPGMRSRMIEGRDELRAAVLSAQGSGGPFEIRLRDIGVRVGPDRTTAETQFIAVVRAADLEDDIIQEFRVMLVRSERQWRIRRVEPLRALEL